MNNKVVDAVLSNGLAFGELNTRSVLVSFSVNGNVVRTFALSGSDCDHSIRPGQNRGAASGQRFHPGHPTHGHSRRNLREQSPIALQSGSALIFSNRLPLLHSNAKLLLTCADHLQWSRASYDDQKALLRKQLCDTIFQLFKQISDERIFIVFGGALLVCSSLSTDV